MNINAAANKLKSILDENQILTDVPMKEHTTFKTGGNADILILPSTKSDIINALKVLLDGRIPYTIVGKGSNLIVRDGGIRGAVIKLAENFSYIEAQEEYIDAFSGATLSLLVRTAHDNGLCGMEYAGGIPGTIGGAVTMNAGAFGGEIKDNIVSVTVLDKDLNEITLYADEIYFGYRKSIIPDKRYIVLEAKFKLKIGDVSEAKIVLRELISKRREKQPLEYPSAGSVFKRPFGYYAGELIERAGFKGYLTGGAQVSEKHAGFIINTGGATSKDIITLIKAIQKKVLEQYGVTLETEVKIIGED